MADRPTFTKVMSPKGVFQFPKLNEPDTKFKAEGEYSVNLVVPLEEATDLIATIDAEIEQTLAAAKKRAKNAAEAKRWETKYRPYKMEEDEDGNETGNVIFKFTAKASGVSKKSGKEWTFKPVLFDAKGKPLPASVKVNGGSVGIVAGEIRPYSATTQTGASVSLALQAAQVLKLGTGGNRDASSFGFKAQDGFDASEFASSVNTEEDAETAAYDTEETEASEDDEEGNF